MKRFEQAAMEKGNHDNTDLDDWVYTKTGKKAHLVMACGISKRLDSVIFECRMETTDWRVGPVSSDAKCNRCLGIVKPRNK